MKEGKHPDHPSNAEEAEDGVVITNNLISFPNEGSKNY